MKGINQFEENYELDTEQGMEVFLEDYGKLAELRYHTTDFDLCDFLMDFDRALIKSLTVRQQQIVGLCFLQDMRQSDVAKALGVTQQTVQEAVKASIKNLARYHAEEKKRGEQD